MRHRRQRGHQRSRHTRERRRQHRARQPGVSIRLHVVGFVQLIVSVEVKVRARALAVGANKVREGGRAAVLKVLDKLMQGRRSSGESGVIEVRADVFRGGPNKGRAMDKPVDIGPLLSVRLNQNNCGGSLPAYPRPHPSSFPPVVAVLPDV